MNEYTVIASVAATGKLMVFYARATNGFHAIGVVAKREAANCELEFHVAIEGRHADGQLITLPGSGSVDTETVLERQDFFGPAEPDTAGVQTEIRPTQIEQCHQIGQVLDASFIKEIATENTGGGCMVDFVTMTDGRVLSLNDEAIGVYASKEAFYDADDGDKALKFMWLNDVKFTDLQARVMVLNHAYACITTGSRSMDVLLTEGMSAAESLRNSAQEMRQKAERLIENAQLLEAAAKII